MERLYLCSMHATGTLHDNGHPAASPTELVCPICIASRHDAPEHDGTETHIVVPRGPVTFDDPRQQVIWDRKQAEAGGVIAGSAEESSTVSAMDDARLEAIRNDHAPKGRRRKKGGYVLPAFREMG